jgi:hypothetical protein
MTPSGVGPLPVAGPWVWVPEMPRGLVHATAEATVPPARPLNNARRCSLALATDRGNATRGRGAIARSREAATFRGGATGGNGRD